MPITGDGPDRGSVRRYDVSTKTYELFVPPASAGGPLGAPWYLTFGLTDPATLTYPAAPLLAGIEDGAVEYLTHDRATVISYSVTVFGANGSLSSAAVQVSDGYENGRDLLSFTNTATITGSWDAATGTLTLSGSDSAIRYQAALRSVKYHNSRWNPNLATRTVSFQISDGAAESHLLSRDIMLTPDPLRGDGLYLGDQGESIGRAN